MSTTTDRTVHVAPKEVHEVLSRHMLADGFPLVLDMQKSHGAWLHDGVKEKEFLDFFTSFSSYPMGYNHPKLTSPEFKARLTDAAIVKVANADLYTTYMAEFVETFARSVPPAYRQHLFFVSGGALAVENALKTAFDWKVRKNLAAGKPERGSKILHFRQAFHGRSGYTLSLTNTDPRKTDYFPKFDWPRVVNPKLSFPLTDEGVAATKKVEAEAIAQIRQALVDYPDEIAGLIIEPIQGEGGDNHFRREFLQALRDLADQNEFLLIFDEVQTGFGTTGKWWCFEHFGVEPDVFAFGKKTQVCGIAATARVDEVDSVFKISSRINSTWGGNLVDMVRAQRFVEIIEEDNLLDNARDVGARLVAGLIALQDDYEAVTNARGRGLFVAFDLPDTDSRDRVLAALGQQNVLGLSCGSRSIRFRPPLILSAEEADEGLARLDAALRTSL
ncbi:MAG: L-lysine 6-transaminase [Thermoanaerobaculia bacterium]|nr:L-lysine 6-transaminase [Thermoanaerobaculia bacterium]